MAIAPNRPANPDARGNAAPCKRRWARAGYEPVGCFSGGVEKLRRLNELKAFWRSLEVFGGEYEKVGFDRGPVGI